MHLAFEEFNEVKRKGLEIMGWVGYSTIQSNIEIDSEEHARSKAAHLICFNGSNCFVESSTMMERSRCTWRLELENVMK